LALLASALTAVLSSGLTVTAVELLARRHVTTIEETVKGEHARELAVFNSERAWKEKAVAELLGPMIIQLDRTRRAFERYDRKNRYLEAKVLREGNLTVKDLLLSKAHLIPPDLLDDAGRFVEHYDRWLEKFDELREAKRPKLDEPFVFVGPDGYPFPHDAEERFKQRYLGLWAELYKK
jgi:hypothetical protein